MKATQIGTCQICGSAQKLPNGRLAKHGYTVEYGWGFNGICNGSGQLPFEISKDYAEATLSLAKTKLENIIAPSEQLDIRIADRNINSPSLTEDQRNLKKQWNEYNQTKQHLSEYIRFQTPRCSAWTPKPLKDVSEESSKQEIAKVATRNVRALARQRDLTKREVIKVLETIERSLPIGTGWNEGLPYPTTASVPKFVATARKYALAELADKAIATLEIFKAAKAAHKSASEAYKADKQAALAA